MKKSTVAIMLSFVAIASIAGAWRYFALSNHTGEEETWIAGRGIVEILTLQESGKYVATQRCDVCPDRPRVGRWSKTNGAITLIGSETGSTVVLSEILYKGCTGLVLTEKRAKGQLRLSDIYFRKGDTCPDSL